MKNLILLFVLIFLSNSCSRTDFFSDDIPQEEITNIILKVTDAASQETNVYNFNMGQTNLPEIMLKEGHVYHTELIFMNGSEDETEGIIQAKDEHFVLYNFPASAILLERTDDEAATRTTDGMRLGLKTKWTVQKVINNSNPLLKISLIHDAVSVSEAQNGTEYGKTEGGETDAEAIFLLKN